MGIPWITLLANVPWKQVIEHTPAVVEGARKLWQTSRHADDAPSAAPSAAAEPSALAALGARVEALERELADSRRQMRAASELLSSLAEQNAQLIVQVETLRRAQRRLIMLAGAALALALLGVWWALS